MRMWKLRVCKLKEHMECWKCLFRSYMMVALTVSVLKIPLLIVALPLVHLHLSSETRIYVTVLFLATWLQMMLTFLLAQEYQAIADVLRIWLQHKSLAFFEVNSKCCGVLGPDDYKFSERPIPASCFRDGSFKHHDLYHDGCSTRSIRPRLVPVLQVTSVIVQYVLVIAIAIYLVIMIRNRAHRRTLWSVRRTELFGTAEPAEVRGSPQDSKLNVLEGYFSVPHRS
ncbi:protein late bloomer isoform X4 [Drosophila biarmipes]|uniref:protein late bloomer isoform X4 n=1 Tax=Drosophila biarmipes TaxID=125945 RepID=UPI0021CCF36E|nr:protein late bloomer isoform X4 [Drosophila biarmipes]